MTLEDVLRDPENIPHVRRWLFEQLAEGLLPPEQAVAVARRIGVELEAERYGIVLFSLPPKDREAGFFADPAAAVRSELLAYFLKYSEYMPVSLFPEVGAVLVKGEARRMDELTGRCAGTVRAHYDRAGIGDWHLAASGPAAGLESLPGCFREASRLWSLQVLRPSQRVFRPGAETLLVPEDGGDGFTDADLARADPAVVRTFLEQGRREDVPAFAARYVQALGPAMRNRAFRDHVLLSVRAAAGLAGGERLDRRSLEDPIRFLEETLDAAVARRDESAFVDQHFAEPDLTLAGAAAHAGVTASYLSALFRKELGCTFTQYVTARRLELARRLLLTTSLRPGQAAREAGFRDERHFSALFKKAYGCTPGRFRAGKGNG